MNQQVFNSQFTVCRTGRAALFTAVLVALLGVSVPRAIAQQQAAPPTTLNGIVAIVNDDVIVASELESRLQLVLGQLRNAGTAPPAMETLRKQVLDRLVVDRLQLQIAERNGVKIEAAELDRAISDIAQRNKLDRAQFQAILERDGFDFATFREEIKDELLIAKVRQRAVQDLVRVSDREIDNFLSNQAARSDTERAFNLSELMIAISGNASREQVAQATTEINALRAQLTEGADFAELAVAHSNGTTALNGGDVGWRRPSELPPLFARAVQNLDIDGLSEVVRSPIGLHIFKVNQVRDEAPRMTMEARVRHILLRESDNPQAILAEYKARAEGNEDFAALARAHSQDTQSAVKGGDLGWRSPGELGAEFDAVLKNLEGNSISAPFRTQSGWHIAQIVERRARDKSKDVLRSQAREQIRTRKLEEEFQSWLRQIRDQAYVEYRLEELSQ